MPNKKMIFHVPNYIDLQAKSGSNIRPLKMIEAFKKNGYDVDIIMGYAKTRKVKIKEIKNNIKNGVKYDFVYSESCTMPTLLTEKRHLPTHPFLDFSFLKYCKQHGIKIGLFYRDIHWKFDLYKKNTSSIKSFIATKFYKYDLNKYKKLLDVMYIPSNSFKEHIELSNNYKIVVLPPGCDNNKEKRKIELNNKLNIFYVGGISKDIYNFEKLLKVVSKIDNINLIMCCREKEWNSETNIYKEYLSNSIKVIHKEASELKEYYDKADLCSIFFENTPYMNMTMPIKMFEYIANYKPIIATNNTEAGDFVKKNDIGYVIDYDEEELTKLLKRILSNKKELEEKVKNIDKIINNNTWISRAKQVETDLK